MRWIRPVARFLLVVVAFAALAGRPAAAGPPEPRAAGAVEAHAADERDDGSRPQRNGDEARRVRSLRRPLRDPWSVGVHAIFRSWGVSTGGGGSSFHGSCLPGGACSPGELRSQAGKPIDPVQGNRHFVEGVAFYAGRLLTAGVEAGAGLDLTTHPVMDAQSVASLATPGSRLGEFSAGEHAAQVFTGERAMQVDLAGRFTYRFGNHDGPAPALPTLPVGKPYLGFGAGVSRYFPGASGYIPLGLATERQPAGVLDHALFKAWTPNLQLYGGFTVRFPKAGPMLDMDLRYVRASLHGLDLGGFRLGTGVRFAF